MYVYFQMEKRTLYAWNSFWIAKQKYINHKWWTLLNVLLLYENLVQRMVYWESQRWRKILRKMERKFSNNKNVDTMTNE